MRVNKEWVLGFVRAHRENSDAVILASQAEIQKLKTSKRRLLFPGANIDKMLVDALNAKIRQEEGYQRCLKDLEFLMIGEENDKGAEVNQRS